MAHLGFCCLGGFVGGFLSAGLSLMTGLSDFQKVITTVIAAAVGGGVFHFIEYLQGRTNGGNAVFAYPVGLVLAMMWSYAPAAAANLKKEDFSNKVLGLGHFGSLLIVSILVLVLFVPAAYRDMARQRAAPDKAA